MAVYIYVAFVDWVETKRLMADDEKSHEVLTN